MLVPQDEGLLVSLPVNPRDGIRTVVIKTIPHNGQRYDTIGDWLVTGTTLTIYTSDLGDWRMSMACALHEMAEALLCVQDGVKEEDVSAFDILYEAKRESLTQHANIAIGASTALKKAFDCTCTITHDSEPGEDRHAPYRRQHAFADGIERLFANAIGVVWDEYSERVTSLEYQPEVNGAEAKA